MNGLDEIRQSVDFLKVMREKYFSSGTMRVGVR